MLNAEKIKVMNKLALYEKTQGKKHLPISKYYRSDYIGIALIKNFFLVTIGYLLVLAGLAAYYGDYLMENIHRMDIVYLGEFLVGGYLIALVAYSVLTYIQYSVKYHLAKKSVKNYYQELSKLEKMYTRENRRTQGNYKAGGVNHDSTDRI
ncbi:MAG: hypothetical protein Q4B26_02435 [Eubacteriales bacterium]|nr:hypothetical protein [Eubacteriales bacterium]